MCQKLCFCKIFKVAYTYNHMKRYVPIVIGVVALCAILLIGSEQMKKDDAIAVEEQETSALLTSFSGKATRVYEGDNILEYGFDLPETATTTVEKDGSLVKVSDGGVPVLAMYLSYEGARGYSPAAYISNVIVPKVAAVTGKGTTTIGLHEWTVVESERTAWHVAKSDNGQWLLVVESPKTESEKAVSIIESIVTK